MREYQNQDGGPFCVHRDSLAIETEKYGPGARRSGFPQCPSNHSRWRPPRLLLSPVAVYASSQRLGKLFHMVLWCYDRERHPLLSLWC